MLNTKSKDQFLTTVPIRKNDAVISTTTTKVQIVQQKDQFCQSVSICLDHKRNYFLFITKKKYYSKTPIMKNKLTCHWFQLNVSKPSGTMTKRSDIPKAAIWATTSRALSLGRPRPPTAPWQLIDASSEESKKSGCASHQTPMRFFRAHYCYNLREMISLKNRYRHLGRTNTFPLVLFASQCWYDPPHCPPYLSKPSQRNLLQNEC